MFDVFNQTTAHKKNQRNGNIIMDTIHETQQQNHRVEYNSDRDVEVKDPKDPQEVEPQSGVVISSSESEEEEVMVNGQTVLSK